MNWGAADEYGPEWPDPGSRRAIVIEAPQFMLVDRSSRSTGSFLRWAETAGRISLRDVRFGPPVSARASFTTAPFALPAPLSHRSVRVRGEAAVRQPCHGTLPRPGSFCRHDDGTDRTHRAMARPQQRRPRVQDLLVPCGARRRRQP